MNINVIWGPGAAANAAPAGFYTAVDYVVNLFDHLFTNNVTININVGYGQIADPATGTAQVVDPSALGESWGANWTSESYTQVVAALQAQNAPGSVTLPSASPEPSGYTLTMDNAEAKALGLAGPSSALDGSIGIATDASAGGWDYSATTPPTSTQTDIIGTIEHEFSEVMGRTSFPFYDPYSNTGASQYAVMDLYRYGPFNSGLITDPYNTNVGAYFSIDGGKTHLGNFNNDATQGDLGDWWSGSASDAFCAFGNPGIQFQLSSTDITLIEAIGWTTSSVACYCRGTLIRTRQGDRPVEELGIGDEVITLSGAARPIKWIGRRSYGGRFIMGRKDVLPICIKAGALGEGVPRRDLFISPHHAMYLDGVLIEARDLVNGHSITQRMDVDEIEYFHLELATHDVILAEGAWSESYLDDDNRGMFHNAQEYRERYPDLPAQPAQYCAPRVEDGEPLARVRRNIAERAGIARAADGLCIGPLRGFVERVDAAAVAGWAQHTRHPEAPVCLDILVEGRLIGRTLANSYREDLAQAGLGSGCHGFVFVPPAGLDVPAARVRVLRSIDGALLPALPMSAAGPAARRLVRG